MQYNYLSASEIRDKAKEMLKGNYGKAIGITVSQLLFHYFANFFSFEVEDGIRNLLAGPGGSLPVTKDLIVSLGGYLLFLLFLVLADISMAGIALFYLKTATGRGGQLADFYYGYQNDTGRFFTISCVLLLPQFVASLPFFFLYRWYLNAPGSVSLPAVIAAAVLATLIQPLVSLFLGVAFYLAMDFSHLSAGEVLRETWQKMSGHRLRFLRLMIGFLPLLLLSLLSFGVGFLWVGPYYRMSVAVFYLDLMKPKTVTSTWERTA